MVVDNCSTDGSVAFIRQQFPQVMLIENQINRGFAAANNQAIQALQTEFVALLNNDTQVDANWLQVLVQAMERDPAVGMVAAKLLLTEQPGVIDSAGIAIDRAGIAWGAAGGQPDYPAQPGAVVDVFGASGGAALYRRTMLDEIGLFDEDFFAYLEDVDLAWRAQWAGWQAVCTPNAVVLHHHSATSQRIPHFKSRLLGRNKLWLIAKNYPLPHLLWYWPLILGYEAFSLAYALQQRRLGSSLTGRLAALPKLVTMFAKRRQRLNRISARAMMQKLQPVELPLRVLRRYRHVARHNQPTQAPQR
jgi:GT2 family glycosyltransferase